MKTLLTLCFFAGLFFSLNGQTYNEYNMFLANEDEGIVPIATTSTSDGAVVAIGTYQVDLGMGVKKEHPYAYKLAADGSMKWFNVYKQGSEEPFDYVPTAIITTHPDEGFMITGNLSNEGISEGGFLLKLAPDGTLSWTRTYDCNAIQEIFSINCEQFELSDLEITWTGGAVIIGEITLELVAGSRALLFKVDQNGQPLAGQAVAYKHPDCLYNKGISIELIGGFDYAFLFEGRKMTNQNNTSWEPKPSVVRLNSNLQWVWAKWNQESESIRSYTPIDMSINSQDQIHIIGSMSETPIVNTLNGNGTEIWTNTLSTSYIYNSRSPRAIVTDFQDNSYILLESEDISSFSDFTHLVSITAAGAVNWSRKYADNNTIYDPKSLCMINNGPFTIPAQDLFVLAAPFSYQNTYLNWDARVLIFDGNTNCHEEGIDIALTEEQYTSFTFYPDIMALDMLTNTKTLSQDEPDYERESCSLFYYFSDQNGQAMPYSKKEVSVFPNPNNGNFSVQIAGLEEKERAKVHLYNADGSLVMIKSLSYHNNELQLEGLPSGTYFLQFISEIDSKTAKVVVQP